MIEEKYAQTLFDNINDWQDRTLARIGRRLKATGRLSAYDQKALKNIVNITGDMNAIYADLAMVTGQNIKEVQTAFERFMDDNMALYKPLYDFRNIPFLPYAENHVAQKIVNHWVKETAGEMINLSRTKALSVVNYGLRNGERVPIGVESMQGAYQSAIDKAVFNVTSGVGDFYSNMRDTIEDMGGSGVRIDYGNGVTRSIDSVIRQNMLFAVKEMQTDYDDQVGKELGCDGFEVNFSATCRPSHAFMEGRMFSYSGAKTIDGVTYPDGAEALERLNDYNCHHRKIAVILGVSEPRYNAAEIAEKNRKTSEVIEYNGKKKTRYDFIQDQRRLEREIRKQKTTSNMAKSAGDNQLVKDCNTRIKALKAKYNDLTESVGLQKTEERMRVVNTSTPRSAIFKENPPKVEKVIRDIEIKNGSLNYERGAVIDKNGNVLKEFNGKEHSVAVTDDDLQLMNGCTFTHNHPLGRFFSDNDIISGFKLTRLHELRATTPQGITYSLTDNGFFEKDVDDLLKGMQEARKQSHNTIIEEAKRMIESGEITLEEYKKNSMIYYMRHEDRYMAKFVKEHATEFGFKYSEIEVKK